MMFRICLAIVNPKHERKFFLFPFWPVVTLITFELLKRFLGVLSQLTQLIALT